MVASKHNDTTEIDVATPTSVQKSLKATLMLKDKTRCINQITTQASILAAELASGQKQGTFVVDQEGVTRLNIGIML